MDPHASRSLTLPDVLAPFIVAAVVIALMSLLREPARRRFNAIFVAGAGSAYLSGGLGLWEFAFAAIACYAAYRGLESYHWIGAAWLLHTAWDVVHHLYGNPIIPFSPTSSAGCAITDTLLAVWFFRGAPTIFWGARADGTSSLQRSAEFR
jgi:hypothetical protein